jgi:hypothetical protein
MFWQVKQPGLEMKATQSQLDLSYQQHYQDVIPEAYECLVPGLILDMYSLNDPTLLMSLCDFTTFLAQLWQILPLLFVPCSNLFCMQSQYHLHLLLFSWSWREKNFLVGIVSHVVVGFLETNWCELLSIQHVIYADISHCHC